MHLTAQAFLGRLSAKHLNERPADERHFNSNVSPRLLWAAFGTADRTRPSADFVQQAPGRGGGGLACGAPFGLLPPQARPVVVADRSRSFRATSRTINLRARRPFVGDYISRRSEWPADRLATRSVGRKKERLSSGHLRLSRLWAARRRRRKRQIVSPQREADLLFWHS